MILADKISLLRKKNGWSQEQLAEQLNISRQSVSKWESGASIPDLDKIIKISSLMGVSTDYLLRDDKEEIEYSNFQSLSEKTYEEEEERIISLEEANSFMELVEKTAKSFAAGVFLCIISPICVMLLSGFSEAGEIPVSEDMAGGIGGAVLLVMIAAAVLILVLNGIKMEKYDYLAKENIVLQYGVRGVVEKKREEFAKRHRVGIAMGAALCILGAVPLLIAAAIEAEDLVYVCLAAALLFFIACGVFMMVWFSEIRESYDKLLEENNFTREKKELNGKLSFFSGAYWCAVTAVFLAVSLPGKNWDTTWIIWPVAGVLFGGLWCAAGMLVKKKRKN